MPFCPKCGYEYEPTVSVCPDCEVDLVEELQGDRPEPGSDPRDNLKELFSTYNPSEASMVKGMLENEGIFCAVENEITSGVWGAIKGEQSRIKVMVKAGDLIRASDMVATYFKDEALEPAGEYIACSNCGAGLEADAKKCPACGESFEGDAGEEFLACSKCGAGVESDAKVCPACGEIFEDESGGREADYFECSNCGAKVDADDDACPVCGEGFDKE